MALTPREPQTETDRLEALSDGVFAVAITLLVLELKVPPPAETHAGRRLAAALLEQWPIYLAYVLSFVFVLITWINHHAMFRVIKRADHTFLILNGLLLMAITTIPFTTELLATYLLQPDKIAAISVYNGVFLLMATTFNRMWAYAARDGRLLDPDADPDDVADITRQYAVGPFLYAVIFLIGLVSAWVSLGLSILLSVFFALPKSLTRRPDKPEA